MRRGTSSAMWQDTRSIYKNQFYFYMLTMNNLKTKVRKSHVHYYAAKRICRKNFNKYITCQKLKTLLKVIKDPN